MCYNLNPIEYHSITTIYLFKNICKDAGDCIVQRKLHAIKVNFRSRQLQKKPKKKKEKKKFYIQTTVLLLSDCV
jgi:hypothetical protein